MTIGEKIQQARLQKNMTQEELAVKAGYAGKSMISRIEAGINAPSFEARKRIADALEIPLEELIDFSAEAGIEKDKNDIEYIYKQLAAGVDPKSRQSLEASLVRKRETLEEKFASLPRRDVRVAFPARELTPAQREMIDLVPTLTPEEISVLVSTARALKAARRDRENQ